MTKKIVALLLALVMVLAMTACAKTEAPKADAPAADAPAADAPAADAPAADAPAADGEVAQLMYYMYSSSDSAVREEVQDAINAYIEPLIGANVTFNMITGGDWSNKAVTGLQAGEEIDIFFTADWLSYMTCVTMELFTPLNDDAGEYGNLLEQYGQGILTSLNPAFITGTQVEGVNYAVPTNKELCVPMGFIYNTDVAAEVGMDPASIKSIADFEPYLAKYLELTGKPGYLCDGSWGDEPWVAGNVSNLSANLIAMKYDPDEATGEFDTTWYSVWETPENKAHVELMYKWYNAGYIHPDSPLSDFSVTNSAEFAAGEWLFVSQPLKGANIKGQELVQASGNKDLHVDEIYGQGKVCITTHAGGSMLAIPRTSNHPVEAMKYINLLHSDKTLLDMELFGVPEKHWVRAEDGRVDVLDSQWYGSHGGAWTKGNTALQSVTTVEDPEKNKKLQEYSEGSLMHPTLGFRYVQQPELEAQWAAVNNVQTEYNRALLTGSVDPATQLPAYIDALKAAGLDDIKANVQEQYDAWLAASGK